MKRVLLLIAFFVGLMPNLKEMNLECVNSVVGQTLYNEGGDSSCEETVEQTCDICGGCYSYFESYCPNCFYYCDKCGLHYEESARHEHKDDEPVDERKYITMYMCEDCGYKTMDDNSLYTHQTVCHHSGVIVFKRLSNFDKD